MDFKTYFINTYPEEGVGYLKNGQFYPVENTAEDRREDCTFDGAILLHKPDVILHSHVRTEANTDEDLRVPSEIDMKNQLATATEWGICETDGRSCTDPIYWGNYDNRPPLKDREFIYNVQDCLSYVQDWYAKHLDIRLPNCARSPTWDQEGKTHMEDNWQKWGFYEVPRSELQEGDVLMFKFLSVTTNHVGIYLGGGRLTWHCELQVPTTALLGRYLNRLVRAVRHKDKE